MKKECVFEAEVVWADGSVTNHGCVAKSEAQFKKMLCNLLYCEEEQIKNVKLFKGTKR